MASATSARVPSDPRRRTHPARSRVLADRGGIDELDVVDRRRAARIVALRRFAASSRFGDLRILGAWRSDAEAFGVVGALRLAGFGFLVGVVGSGGLRLRRRRGVRASRRWRPSTPRCPGRPTGRSRTRAAPAPGRSSSGHVDEVDPDAVPERRPAAHAVDEDVRRLEVARRSSGWRAFQRSRPSSALVLELGAGDLDDRDRRLAAAGRRRLRADPLGRQARVRVAGGDGGRALGGDLRRRPARLAAARLVLGRRPARLRRLDARRLAGLLARSSAATARRPGPRPRGGPTAPGAPRASRPPRRCPRPGRRCAANRAGTVSSVNASASTVGDLVPGQRHRDPRVGRRPDGVGRRHRPVLGVLVVVEEHAVALLLPPLARWRGPGRAARRRGRARAPRGAPRGYVQRGSIRTLMWMPREPDVLGQPTSPTASSASRATSATSRICGHGDAGHRVEVDPQLVGMVEVLGADRVRVEVDAAEVDDPGEPGGVVDDDLVGGPPGRERERRRPDPRRARSRAPASGRTAARRRRRRTA